jgi:hypothetical protein
VPNIGCIMNISIWEEVLVIKILLFSFLKMLIKLCDIIKRMMDSDVCASKPEF